MAICSYQKRASLESDIVQLNFKGTELEQVDECKILGLLIDEKLTWKPHIDRICFKYPLLLAYYIELGLLLIENV